MSIISKIREKSGLAVGIIAVSLILFIVGGDLLGTSSFFGGNNQEVGNIAGEKILYPDYQAKLDLARQNFEGQNGRAATEADLVQLREQAWNQFIIDIAYKKEYDKIGLKVTPEELVDMVQGNHISPLVQQLFGGQQGMPFDKNQVIAYLQQLKKADANSTQGQQARKQWADIEKGVAAQRLAEKYENLLTKTSYVTKAEAEKEYVAQTTKASVKYLYVPFYSMADTLVKVSDSQLSDYLSKHKDEFEGQNTRTLQYVTYPIIPSKDDSVALYSQIRSLAKGLATAPNDSAFAKMNSDVAMNTYMSIADMPEQLKSVVKTFLPGSINGPFKEGNTYFIYKYGGTKADTNFTVRASHILIRPTGTGDSAKAEARKKAVAVLAQIKGGATFEAMAATNGGDGTAQRGGDLGYFKNNGGMVKKFQDAVFGFSGTGLLPNIVETEFGFHIIKVTEAKSNTLYKVVSIGKTITPSQATRDAIYAKAEQFVLNYKTKEQFEEGVKKEKLVSATANRLADNATSINTMQNVREVVRWAFNEDTDMNKTSAVFEADNNFVIGVVTGKTDKENVRVEDFKDELTAKVRNEIKGEQMAAKLKGIKGATLEDVAKGYGAGAVVETANDITLASGFLTSAGFDPGALGKAFGLKVGKRSGIFTGENGVFIMEQTSSIPAPIIADYSQYKTTLNQRNQQQTSYFVSQAIKDNAKITDNRSKFY